MTPRIFIHTGLPKTGTSALQQTCYAERERLSHYGLMYDDIIHSPNDPKHQWAINALKQPGLLDSMDLTRLAQPRNVLISTESITNELPFLTESAARHFIETLSDYGDPHLVVVTREAHRWALSYYKQAIANQPSKRFEFYSTSLLFNNFRQLPHVQLLADRNALSTKMHNTFGHPVEIIDYGPNLVSDLIYRWSGYRVTPSETKANTSLSDEAAEIFRQLNATITSQLNKAAWARIMVKTGIASGSMALKTLSQRATKEAVLSLDPSNLRAVDLVDNPPLQPDPAIFFAAKQKMLDTLLRLQT